MKLIIKTITTIGIASFLTACSGKSIPLHQQQKHVENIGENYYYIPNNAIGGQLNKKWAYLNVITSSGLLNCKENDAFLINKTESENEDSINKIYLSNLTVEELKKLNMHPTFIPKRNSKEFQNLIDIDTHLVREGMITCLSPMSKKDVLKYKEYAAQQEKINNDPRVVAARIEAASRRDQAQARREQAQATRDTASAIKNATTQRRIESYTPKTNYNYNYNYNYGY